MGAVSVDSKQNKNKRIILVLEFGLISDVINLTP